MFTKYLVIFICTFYIFFSSCTSSTEPQNDNLVNLVSGNKEAGVYVYLWHQKDKYNNVVPEGKYKVNIKFGKFKDSKNIIISSSVSPVQIFYPSTQKINDVIPKNYNLAVYLEDNAVGDTVVIIYNIPTAGNVVIDITKD